MRAHLTLPLLVAQLKLGVLLRPRLLHLPFQTGLLRGLLLGELFAGTVDHLLARGLLLLEAKLLHLLARECHVLCGVVVGAVRGRG